MMKKYILCFCVILCTCAMFFSCGSEEGNEENQWQEKGNVVSVSIEVLPNKTEFIKGELQIGEAFKPYLAIFEGEETFCEGFFAGIGVFFSANLQAFESAARGVENKVESP